MPGGFPGATYSPSTAARLQIATSTHTKKDSEGEEKREIVSLLNVYQGTTASSQFIDANIPSFDQHTITKKSLTCGIFEPGDACEIDVRQQLALPGNLDDRECRAALEASGQRDALHSRGLLGDCYDAVLRHIVARLHLEALELVAVLQDV